MLLGNWVDHTSTVTFKLDCVGDEPYCVDGIGIAFVFPSLHGYVPNIPYVIKHRGKYYETSDIERLF